MKSPVPYRRPGGRTGDGTVITVWPDRARSLSNGWLLHSAPLPPAQTFTFARLLIPLVAPEFLWSALS